MNKLCVLTVYFIVGVGLPLISNADIKTAVIKHESLCDDTHIKYPQGFAHAHINKMIKAYILTLNQTQKARILACKNSQSKLKPSLYAEYEITYQTPRALSVVFHLSRFQTNAAHPNNTVHTLNFIDDKQVQLADLMTSPSQTLRIIAPYCQQKLLKNDDFDQAWVKKGTASLPKNYTNWTFDDNGLAILFDTYQVAAYVFGPQTVVVPYTTLNPYLKNSVKKRVWNQR